MALQHLDGIVAWALWAVERKLMSADMLYATSTRKGASADGQSLLGAAEHFLALLLPREAQLDTFEGGAATQVFGLELHRHGCCFAHVMVSSSAECGRPPSRRPQLCRDHCISFLIVPLPVVDLYECRLCSTQKSLLTMEHYT